MDLMDRPPSGAEARTRKQRVDAARLELLERDPSSTLKELLTATLDLAEALTGSQIGFFHFVDSDESTLWLQAWSTNTVARMCTAEGAGAHYPIDQAGVWADCVRTARPVVHNDYASLGTRKGLPPGHARVARELTVPVMRAGRVCAVLGVGNKPLDYDDGDVEDVANLADLAWDIAARKRAQDGLRASEERYRDLVELSPDAIFVNRADRVDLVNRAALSLFGAERAEQLVGKPVLELFHAGSHALIRERIAKLLQGEKVPVARERVTRLDGMVRDVEVTAAPFRDARGTAIQVVLHDVTDQLRRESALQASEAQFRELVLFLAVPIALNDPQGRILLINERFTQVLGYTPEDIPTVADWFHRAYPNPAYRAQVMETWGAALRRAAAAGREIAPEEYRVSSKSGEVRAMLISGRPIGKNLLVTFVDVTERRRAEEELRLQQSRLDLAVRSGRAGLWDLDLATGQAWRTLQHDQLFGYDELQPAWGTEEALRHVVPEDRPIFRKAFEDALATGRFHYELRIDPRGGPRRWIEATGEVYRDQEGRAVRMAGTVVDVTERKRAEEAIRSASAYARNLIEASLDPLVVVGPDGKVTDVNAATEAMTGVPRGRLAGSDFADSFTEPEKARAGLQRVFSTGAVRDYSLTVRHASGRTTEVIFSASVYAGPDGKVQGIFAAARDVTELRALQAKVALSARLAAMGTLVAGVAHEINNPLSAVMAGQGLSLEMSRELRKRLQDRMLLDPEAEIRQLDDMVEALEDAWEGGQRIAGIVKELAAIARPDPARTRVRLADVAAKAVRWVRPFLETNVAIEVQDLGAPDVMAAASRIEQVVVNLLTNAAKATAKGKEGEVVVRIGPGAPGQARLEVIDRGAGIPPAILDRIFEPFFTTRQVGKGKGPGLGLALSHAIATSHGGTLTAESTPGQGSTFRLELPVAQGAAPG
jgi:PAS domain S-box-containing protein